MAGLCDHPWAFAFGILGNLISFMVYLAPIPTFIRIYKNKATGGFQSLPYVAALFSAMLWIYYAFIKTDEYLLVTINSFGCVIETIYIAMFLTYALRKIKIYTTKVVLILNVGVFSLIVLFTLLLDKGPNRVKLMGWICVVFAVSVFAAPLSIISHVIKTKSVEFMPFTLSFFLTLSAIVWFSYGLFTKNIHIAIPNIVGFTFGVTQMVVYKIYKDRKVLAINDEKLPEFTRVSTPKLSETRVTPQGSEEMIFREEEAKTEEENGKELKKKVEGEDAIDMSPG